MNVEKKSVGHRFWKTRLTLMGTSCAVQAPMMRLYVGSAPLAALKSGSSPAHVRKQISPWAGCRVLIRGGEEPRSIDGGIGGKPGGSMAGTKAQCILLF